MTGSKVLLTLLVAGARRRLVHDGSSIAADVIRRRSPIECLLVKGTNG